MNIEQLDNYISDEQLTRLFDGKEAGKSFPDALRALEIPSLSEVETHELRSLWDLHGDLTRTAHAISPNPDLLHRITTDFSLEQAPIVTAQGQGGYHREGQGHINSIIGKTNALMQMNWKVATPIAVVLLAVVTVVSMGGKEGDSVLQVGDESMTMQMAAESPEGGTSLAMKVSNIETPITGDVDDLALVFAREADGDLDILSDSEEDLSIVSSDDAELTSFTTAYDETTF